MDYNVGLNIYKTLSDLNRLKIIHMLAQGEQCSCQLLEKLNIGQPTLSHHIKTLYKANLINIRKVGKHHYYSINGETLNSFKNFNLELFDKVEDPDFQFSGCRYFKDLKS